MAVLGGVNRRLSSEGTLSRCPGFARFTFLGSPVGALRFGTVIQLLGLGNWSRLVEIAPSKPPLPRVSLLLALRRNVCGREALLLIPEVHVPAQALDLSRIASLLQPTAAPHA